ncbi:TetR family transcriptional regulator [Sphaerisporangium krabiense]|uniref:AcrR family transcriptional regulator n=1 Tax=Sphaerisporangium krabiense TaxID=763782 RepID=A0A7W9DRI2_9ACTN|nr:TetR/AcrR family transcriptional regulator [Sphaerisporangium krabiense]MBB5628134.1 AcrR family transcriptional regulator [Sphaerisporangium krabiense]GII62301.1 TetR family transcriptional regulator [Sphaerisporangium krabiense]
MTGQETGEELRADARRNREALLAVARAAFAEEGTDASLREIARRAGVGIGTLYRHFPTREALLEAALRDGLESLRAAADDSLDAESPIEALAAWLERFSARSSAWCGLPRSVLTALHSEKSELHATSAAMVDAATRLLVRAQEAGEVRADVEPEDLFAAAAAIGWVAENADPGRAARILTLLRDGLRPVDG